MSESINTVYVQIPLIEVKFDVTPKSTLYNSGGWTWPAIVRSDSVEVVPAVYTYLANTELTFMCNCTSPIESIVPEAIRWRFGDGIEAEGEEVTHTYTMVREMIVHCSVKDNLDRWSHTSKVLYLKP